MNGGGYSPAPGAPGYPPAGAVPQAGGYPPAPSAPGYPPAGAVPTPGGYPPAGADPTSGGYPPAGAVPTGGGYPPAVAVPASGGYPPAGAVPSGGNPNEPVAPSAPPMDKMDLIPGYDPNSLTGGDLSPPSYDDATRGSGPPDRSLNTTMPTLNEDQAQEALMELVSQHCCYGKKPAEQMNVLALDSSMAFHYTLNTFSESRSTAWTQEPYKGQPIDGPQNGPAPGAWDIRMAPQQKFVEAKTSMEVPHTASVKPCHACIGLCRVRCNHCQGQGRKSCSTCNGSGHRTVHRDGHHERETCNMCNGDGRRRCMFCDGHGQVKCRTCEGRGQLKCYIKLTVQWKKHQDDHVVERTALPDQLVTKAKGMVAFDEEQPLVWPINHFPDAAINQASSQIVQKHKTSWPQERILLQRHRVRVVPVTQVSYRWKEHQGTYFIYGVDNLVHAPDYPQKCCWGCTIL